MDNAVLLYDVRTKWPAVFGVSRTNRRASRWHPNTPTRGIEEGTGAASAVVEEKKEKKKQKRLKALFHSLRLSPRSPAFFSVPPHFIPVHHAVPSISPKPPQTHRPVLRCAPLLAALHITYYGLAFYPLYYMFGHYNQRKERESRREQRTRTYVHGWIHESDSWRIKWHCDVFRHCCQCCPCHMLAQSRAILWYPNCGFSMRKLFILRL